MLELQDFSKSYKSRFSKKSSFTVENINLTVQKGHILGLLGLNGSGKTTIIKAICGFHYATSGKVLLSDNNGNTVDVSEHSEKAMELCGYVPEKSILPPDLYVKEFLEYTAGIHGIKGESKEEAVKTVIKECGLSKVLIKKIKELSKGYQQRVSFAQAIIHNPPILILDEPVSGLDPAQIIQMRNLIKKLSETKAVLMSTHLLQEVYSLCNEICIINQGKMVAYGTEKEILSQCKAENLEKAFMELTSSSEAELLEASEMEESDE